MVGDLRFIASKYAPDAREAVAAAPAMPPRVMEIHLTPEQRASLSSQWKDSGEAATELIFTAGDGRIGSLRISCGWIAEPS